MGIFDFNDAYRLDTCKFNATIFFLGKLSVRTKQQPQISRNINREDMFA